MSGPAPAHWLPPGTPQLNRAIVETALSYVGTCEEPLGSNRSPLIDAWLRRAGVPESMIVSGAGYWCAAAAGAWWLDGGGPALPAGYGSCDVLMAWAHRTGRWSKVPLSGAFVVYGKPGDASHIGVVVRTTPLLLAVEGNTSIGGQFSRNGVAVDLKEVDRARLLGYIHPEPHPVP